jgi:flagellar motility protein MotE (MotC chaperone)
MGNRLEGNWLRRIPLLFDFLSWASWIIRVRKIARMAFTLEANLSETRVNLEANLSETRANLEANLSETRANLEANLSETRLEIDHLGQQFRSLETNFEAHLGAFFVASMENTRTIDALRVEIDALRSQNV